MFLHDFLSQPLQAEGDIRVHTQKFRSICRATEVNQSKYPSIDSITVPTVGTDQAAFYLGRKPQTLRAWACYGTGPIDPVLVNGRQHWLVPVIKNLLKLDESCQQVHGRMKEEASNEED